MPSIIGGARQVGKTVALVKKAHAEDLYIICSNHMRVKHVVKTAEYLGLDIRYPISVDELPLKSPFIKRVLVDDAEDVLRYFIGKPIESMSTSHEMKPLLRRDQV